MTFVLSFAVVFAAIGKLHDDEGDLSGGFAMALVCALLLSAELVSYVLFTSTDTREESYGRAFRMFLLLLVGGMLIGLIWEFGAWFHRDTARSLGRDVRSGLQSYAPRRSHENS